MNWMNDPTLKHRTILFLWIYDIIKFVFLYDVFNSYGVNPWMFLFIDVTTVPAFIAGWSKLITSLTGKAQSIYACIRWGVITFFASTGPYLYVAWAGRQSFSKQAWIILAVVLILMFANMAKQIIVSFKKNSTILPLLNDK